MSTTATCTGIAKIDKIIIRHMADPHMDLDNYGKYTSKWEPGAIDRQKRRDMGHNEHRYFVSTNNAVFNPKDWAHVSDADKQKVIDQYGSLEKASEAYAEQDYQRAEEYGRQNWWYIGIKAEAIVSWPPCGLCQAMGHVTTETIESDACWGIESDDKSGRDEISDEEIHCLLHKLKEFPVDLSNWDALVAEAELLDEFDKSNEDYWRY